MPRPIRAITALRLYISAVALWSALGAATAQGQAEPAPEPPASVPNAPSAPSAQAAATTPRASPPETQPLTAAMKLERGATCLDSEQLVEHISSWLGTDHVAAPLAIEVQGSPFFARTVWIRIRQGRETVAERRFEPAPARCADLHAAVGLAIALALKASLLDSLIGTPPDDPTTSRPFRFAAHALGGAAVVPGIDLGLGIGMQYTFAERLAGRLTFLGVLGPRGEFADDEGRFKTWLAAGRLDLCSRLVNLQPLSLSVCVGIAAGGLYATGEAFPMSRHALIPYVAVANALELDLELSTSWSLTLALDVLVPLRRTTFVVRDQSGAVLARHDLAGAGALIALGPAYHF